MLCPSRTSSRRCRASSAFVVTAGTLAFRYISESSMCSAMMVSSRTVHGARLGGRRLSTSTFVQAFRSGREAPAPWVQGPPCVSLSEGHACRTSRCFSSAAPMEERVSHAPEPPSLPLPDIPITKPRRRQRRTVTGGLKNLPIAMPANELLTHAMRAAQSQKIDEDKIKNARMRARKLGALRLDTLCKSISKPLKDVIKAYEYELSVLHPFEATLADLTVRARISQGYRTLDEVLNAVNELRKQVLEVGKEFIAQAKNATKKIEAIEHTERGIKAVQDVVNNGQGVVLDLIEVQKSLRKLPVVRLNVPTIVLVGAPNVGKSSIVRAISSGTPEVNNYPFTTRGMTLGHIRYLEWEDNCQIMDTPGVLNRPDSERNEMEALTLASMQHLPTGVMFVLDLTGEAGVLSSIENQIQIRNDLRRRFPKRPWVDVVSKADIDKDNNDPAVHLAPEGAIDVSVVDGTGIPELKVRVKEMLTDVREVLLALRLREEQQQA